MEKDSPNINDEASFGYQKISKSDKSDAVNKVFSTVAHQYEIMNDFMSLGLHRLLKHHLVNLSEICPHHRVLDLAGGTGDISKIIAPTLKNSMILADQNIDMISYGRNRLLDLGIHNIEYIQAEAENLPFASSSFDNVLISFGLRNFTDFDLAFSEIHRILKPKGVLSVLEFSQPQQPFLKKAYQSFQSLWPKVGKIITGSSEPYQYLIESIEVHPNQEKLASQLNNFFSDVSYHNLLNGIVAIHKSYKAE